MLDAIRWDANLIRRYNRAGPGYCSYPLQRQFHEDVSSFELLHALRESRKARRPLSLYVHLPFCNSACFHCDRLRIVTQDRELAARYLHYLQREIDLISCYLDRQQQVEQLHLGGGTPTFFNQEELRQLMAHLRQRFTLLDDSSTDYSIDVDPRSASWSTMGLLRELGFNRVNLGVEDLAPQVQSAVNRQQSLEQTCNLVEAARTLQYRSINIELTYGLPQQTPESFAHTLQTIMALQPERLSLRHYQHRPERFPLQQRINALELPGDAGNLAMLENSIEQLTRAGYRYIGLEQFALNDDELAIAQEDGLLQRNVHGYTSHGHCDLIGLGVSAISQVGDLYCQNTCDLEQYLTQLHNAQLSTCRGHTCSLDDRLRRHIIQRLLCEFELEFSDIEKPFGIDFRSYFADIWNDLQQMANDGLIELCDRRLDITASGRLLVRSVCMLFDRYRKPLACA